jgi:integrase
MARRKTGGKRGNGEGSIYRHKDGRFVARVTMPGGVRKALYGRTRDEAAGKLHEALRALRNGLSLPSERLTVADFAERWLGAIRSTVRPRTIEIYESLIRVHIVPRLGRIKLARLSPADLQRAYADVAACGLSPKSVRHVHVLLHNMLEKAVRWDFVVRNVADLVESPRVPPRDLVVLDAGQARSFLSACRGHRLEGLFVLAITTGARSGELLGLSWDQVDLDGGTITIRRSLQELGGEFALAEPKTSRSRRTVALTTIAVDALRRHRVRQLEESLRLGPAWRNDWNLVFTNEVGAPVDRHNLLPRDYRPLLAKAGLPVTLRFHDLRHIAASLALGQGMPIPAVSEMLGHADAAITLRVYAHAVPGAQRQVAQAMQAILAG